MNISQTKLVKLLSVHEPTNQMQTYYELVKMIAGPFESPAEIWQFGLMADGLGLKDEDMSFRGQTMEMALLRIYWLVG